MGGAFVGTVGVVGAEASTWGPAALFGGGGGGRKPMPVGTVVGGAGQDALGPQSIAVVGGGAVVDLGSSITISAAAKGPDLSEEIPGTASSVVR